MQEFSITTNRPKFSNKMLEKATLALMTCVSDIKSRQFTVASILAEVEVEKLYQNDGFASCAEYAERTFGIKKSNTYALITIGRDFTRPILNDKGKISGHCSNLLPPANMEKQDAPLIDFTTRQIALFATLGREQVINLISDGSLSPTMTANQIRDLVKAQKALAAPAEQTEESAPAEQTEESALAEQTEESAPAEQTEESAPAEQTESVNIGIERPETFDNLSSDILIAELRKRGFKVFRDNVEQIYNW